MPAPMYRGAGRQPLTAGCLQSSIGYDWAVSTPRSAGAAARPRRGGTVAGRARCAWAVAMLIVVQAIVCGLAVLPVLAVWGPLLASTADDPVIRLP